MTLANKPVRRETYTQVRERGRTRPLIIEVHPTYVRVKLKGMRSSYTVTYDQLWTMGARNAAEARRREKIAAREARKKEG